MGIGYGNIKEKNDVNLTKIREKTKRLLKKKGANEYFNLPVFQNDCSDNNYLPEKVIFTLPVKFVNLLYNYAYTIVEEGENEEEERKLSPTKALEHFLTNVVKTEEILRFIPQRPKHHDNQSRRLHSAIAYQVQHQKGLNRLSKAQKIARRIIEDKKPEFDAMVQDAIITGKSMYNERRLRESA